MERRSKITIHPPDARGLREVRIGGETVGGVWSPRELRILLRRHGAPPDIDLDDRALVSWIGGGSDTWPDRTWRRRGVIALMVAGLVTGAVLLIKVGAPDAFNALTFAGRISGFLFILGGVTEVAAALAAVDYWGKRGLTVSGALVLVGVLIALSVTALLIFVWSQEMEYTRYMLVVFPLCGWSLWALSVAIRGRVWRGTPHPTRIAAGVLATVLLAAVNIAYSSLYQPTTLPAKMDLSVRFEDAGLDLDEPVYHLPVTFRLKNTGSVPLYILIDDWSVYGRGGKYVENSEELRERREALEQLDHDTWRHTESVGDTVLAVGQFSGPGTWYEPGEEYSQVKIVEIPKASTYNAIKALLNLRVMRMDRGRIDLDTFGLSQFSWKEESVLYCPVKVCHGEFLIYHAPVRDNNNLVNVTRRPRYVTAWWGMGEEGSAFDAAVSKTPGKGIADDAETRRESRRYDLFTVTADTSIPFAAIVRPRP